MLEAMQRIVAILPFNVLTGAEVLACGGDSAEVSMSFDQRFRQHYGILHGGRIGYPGHTAISGVAAQ